MTPQDFQRYAFYLTGTEVKGESEIDNDSLATILADDTKPIDCSHLNELLLLVHKDRIEQPFFEHFFGRDCTVGTIADGVQRFQRTALLLYGNFVFAFRTLSRIKDRSEFQEQVADATRDPVDQLTYFRNRQKKLLEVDQIRKHQTPFVGYLSVGDIVADRGRCELLLGAVRALEKSRAWQDYLLQIETMAKPENFDPLKEIVENYREKFPSDDLAAFEEFLQQSMTALSSSPPCQHS